MKKGLTILLLFVYSITTFGMGGTKVCFCSEHPIEGAVTSQHSSCSKDTKHNNCCSGTQRLVSMQENCIAKEVAAAQVKATLTGHVSAGIFGRLPSGKFIHHIKDTPQHNGVALYIFHCNFRI